MELSLARYVENAQSTLGKLSIDGSFECYTCEDAYHQVKIHGQTRIPAGVYKVFLRTTPSRFDERYITKFGKDFYKGMLELSGVPNYEGVLIHTGNSAKDTEGCILVGDYADRLHLTPEGSMQIFNSADAFHNLYPKVLKALTAGEVVHITITDDLLKQPTELLTA